MALWIRPGLTLGWDAEGKRSERHFAAHFDIVNADGAPVNIVPGLPRHAVVDGMDVGLVRVLAGRILGGVPINMPRRVFEGTDRMRAETALTVLLMEFELRSETLELAPHITDCLPPPVAASLDALARRLQDDPAGITSISALAAELRLAPNNFAQQFRRRFGLTPRQYVLQRRLVKSEGLLRETDLSVKEIAYRLRFHDPAHFSHRFRDRYDMAPTAFRRHARLQG
ncbi:MAG: helix-turn-helix transcriptional regulator [Lentisphaerae bacterium]|nr:helix-turn-helix transcriptional regulator [Lentisphaerota bacterium]